MTYIKHESGSWVVYVDGNPRFALMYEEEARAIEGLIDALIEAKVVTHHSICGLEWAEQEPYFNEADGEHLIWLRKVEKRIEQALKKAGAS